MEPPSYMQSVVDRNVVMRRITVLSFALEADNRSCGTKLSTSLSFGCSRITVSVFALDFETLTKAMHLQRSNSPRNSSSTASPFKIRPIDCPETSASKYNLQWVTSQKIEDLTPL